MTEIKTLKKIDASSAPKLDAALKAAIDGGELELVIEMSETTYISSVGLRAIASAQKKMNKNGGTMVLRHAQDCIKEIFEVTGFGGVIKFED
jgi:anti-anti-sigma factor